MVICEGVCGLRAGQMVLDVVELGGMVKRERHLIM